jgi:mono/diheme cytochrome c family protein
VIRARTVTLFALALATGTTASLEAAPRAATYTAAQAWDGRLDYYRSCAECHGGTLGGVFGPALAGKDGNLQYQSVSAVYGYMAAHMPHGDPEGLSDSEYVAIMAFLMQSHGIRSGTHELTKPEAEADKMLMGPK